MSFTLALISSYLKGDIDVPRDDIVNKILFTYPKKKKKIYISKYHLKWDIIIIPHTIQTNILIFRLMCWLVYQHGRTWHHTEWRSQPGTQVTNKGDTFN